MRSVTLDWDIEALTPGMFLNDEQTRFVDQLDIVLIALKDLSLSDF